tara:strand:+ start:187 stop:690 length:504 start_codon:yes stop_codon:yes gene_type:complete
MDNELKEIEAKLKKLKPSKFESNIYQKIDGIFDSQLDGPNYESNNKTIVFPVFLQRIAAAAAILIACVGMFFAFLNESNKNNLSPSSNNNIVKKNKENDNNFVPIKTKNTFEGVSRDEIFISKDRIPYQPVKYQFSDSFIWENKTDGSVIELNIPSQRFFYVPIKTD